MIQYAFQVVVAFDYLDRVNQGRCIEHLKMDSTIVSIADPSWEDAITQWVGSVSEEWAFIANDRPIVGAAKVIVKRLDTGEEAQRWVDFKAVQTHTTRDVVIPHQTTQLGEAP